MVVRLFSVRRDRDRYFLAAISFLMVLAAAILTVDSIFLLAFAAFMLMAVVTFILMEMGNASAHAAVQSNDTADSAAPRAGQSKGPGDAAAHRRMAFSIAATSPVLVLFILLGAAAIFFVLPRIS